jgi:peptide subunit release factor RF-3
MANESPSAVIKQVDNSITMLLRKINPDQIGEKSRDAIAKLKQALIDSRIYSRDYELSETRDEQVANAKKANKYIEQARQSILRASEFDVFGPIDVAHLSAQLDQAKADLK